MPAACPRCGALTQPGTPSCGHCGYVLAPAASTFLTLTFPAEHPDHDAAPAASAPAPTLMPAPRALPLPPRVPAVAPTQAQRKAVLGAVAVAVVVGIVVTVALLAGGSGDESPGTAAGGGQDEQVLDGTVLAPADLPSTPTPPPVPPDENAAHQLLLDQVEKDRAKVEALAERWVPQLSSKRPGLEVAGTVFDYRAIWSDFTSLAARYPGAMLLWSGGYTSFRLPDFWVTIAPQSFDSGELANGWCDSEGFAQDDCYAKRITHTGTFSDSTVLRK